jgi:hypothetical protein
MPRGCVSLGTAPLPCVQKKALSACAAFDVDDADKIMQIIKHLKIWRKK